MLTKDLSKLFFQMRKKMMNYHVNCDPLKLFIHIIDEHSLVPYLLSKLKVLPILFSSLPFLQIHLMLIELVKNNLKK